MHKIELFQKLSEQLTISVKYLGLFIRSLLFSSINIFFSFENDQMLYDQLDEDRDAFNLYNWCHGVNLFSWILQ